MVLILCQQILENHTEDIGGRPTNTTDSNSTVSPDLSRSGVSTSSRETYDNAYFYIMVVMFFYTFLAMSLFKCFVSSDEDKKDPYEEFINTDQSSRQKFNAEKFDFEDESSL